MNAKDRFYSRKWGVFNHYIYGLQNNPESEHSYYKQLPWDEHVKDFDTEVLAKNLHEMGAGYYCITVMQCNKYMIAPNATFDRIAGTVPGEACSTRDLIEDLYTSLSKYDIDLFLYFTGDGPWRDHPEGDRFGFVAPREDGVTMDFVKRWASVLEEYAVRYGDKVEGWWIDGVFDSFKYTNELMEPLYAACKKGNPEALVAFNNGGWWNDYLEKWFEHEDFLAGERNDFDIVPDKRFYDGAQAHVLAPIGLSQLDIDSPKRYTQSWGAFGLKHTKEYLADYLKKANAAGAVVTFDMGVHRDGRFDPVQIEAITYAGKSL
ncbi:MAG: hypothetical protein IKL59_08800 [Clostridia bacterium]|nr:hypothetical protein [Clostridia bacterium]